MNNQNYNSGLYYGHEEYYRLIKDVLESNLKAVNKLKPFKRPQGVKITLERLLYDTEVLISAIKVVR